MNDVKSEDICPCVPLPVKEPVRMKILNAMKVGRRYRPYQFKSQMIKDSTIAKHLNRLHDEGFVNRVLEGSFLYWVRIK